MQECHSLFFLTLPHLHQSLWKLWWLPHQTPKSLAPQLQHCPCSTQGLLTQKLCHTRTHDVAGARLPPPPTGTTRCTPQKRTGTCARLQCEKDQLWDSTNEPKLKCSYCSATEKLVLLNAIFLTAKVRKEIAGVAGMKTNCSSFWTGFYLKGPLVKAKENRKRVEKPEDSKGQLVRHWKEGTGTLYHLPFLKEKTLYIVSVPLTWEMNIKNITFRNYSVLISSKLYNNKKIT